MQAHFPCDKCNTDEGSPLCLRDERCPCLPSQSKQEPKPLVDRVTDTEITKAFEGTNFGRTDFRHLLALSVLKKALNYHCGHTVTQIMVKMGLTTEKGRVTERGRLFCYEQLDAGRSG